jgi:hypothetical protein
VDPLIQEQKLLQKAAKIDTRRNERKRELRKEHQVVNQNMVVDFSNQEAQARVIAASTLKTGRKRLHGRILDSLKTEKEIKEMAAIHAATKQILRDKKINLSRKQKKAISFELTKGVSFETAKELVGGSDRTIRKLRALSQADIDELWDDDGPTITDPAGDTSPESDLVECLILNMYATFFIKHSGVLSGADRDKRTLAMPKHKLLSILFGEIPSMLRTLVISHPKVLNEVSPGSRLYRSIHAAMEASKQADFDCEKEVSYRTAMAEAIYRQDLDKKRMSACKIIAARVKPRLEDDTFTPDQIAKAREIMPIGDATFWGVLKRKKIKYTTNLKPTLCDLCDNGVVYEATLAQNTQQRLEHAATIDRVQKVAVTERRESSAAEKQTIDECKRQLEILLSAKRNLDPLIHKYQMHKAQYAKCRPYVQKLEDELVPGECIVYRDFVCPVLRGRFKDVKPAAGRCVPHHEGWIPETNSSQQLFVERVELQILRGRRDGFAPANRG